MTPIAIGESFGWLHHADGDRGVVLCATMGYEGLCVHQSWRVLADRLAAAGLPTLRFDYPGEGDSLGEPDEPELVARWREQIRMSVRWMREVIGVNEVVLVGLRLGAALAAEVGGVEHLVQLAPVVKGSTYLRELKVMARMLDARGGAQQERASDELELEGFSVAPHVAADIKRIDLTRLAERPAPRALVMLDPAARPAADYVQALEALGANVETRNFLDYPALTPAPMPPPAPIEDFDAIVAFARRGAGRALASRPPQGALATESFIERATLFGPRRELAGVLCLPRGKPKATFLLLDTGANHHIGCGRSSVDFARALARQGVASLRMDSLGVGDSAPIAGGPRAVLYRMERAADVTAALDFLEERGLGDATLFGVCSGAALALYAALADTRVKALILANIQLFGRVEGEEREKLLDMDFGATSTYVAKAMSARSWARVARGEVPVRKLFEIATALIRRKATAFIHRLGLEAAYDKAQEARDNFAVLAARGVRVLVLHGDHDVGREALDTCFGQGGRYLRGLPNVTMEIIEGADHTLSSALSREVLLRKMIASQRSMERGDSCRDTSKSLLGALTMAALGAFAVLTNQE